MVVTPFINSIAWFVVGAVAVVVYAVSVEALAHIKPFSDCRKIISVIVAALSAMGLGDEAPGISIPYAALGLTVLLLLLLRPLLIAWNCHRESQQWAKREFKKNHAKCHEISQRKS